ncbi:MAG: hypothetical protein MJ218_03505 [Opitutales bacterium]|nr:hypothetical protein [Opitutales bacterium]
MPVAPSFRTIVNELGVSPSILALPFNQRCNLTVPIKTYSYWFWSLASLTFDYTYIVGGQTIHRTHVVHPSKSELKDRIAGVFTFSEQPAEVTTGQPVAPVVRQVASGTRPTTKIVPRTNRPATSVVPRTTLPTTRPAVPLPTPSVVKTSIVFPIGSPHDKNLQGDEKAIQEQHVRLAQQQPLFCSQKLRSWDDRIYLTLSFVEQNGLSVLCTHPELYQGYSTIHTYSVPFMDQTLMLSLMVAARDRQPLVGSIQSFSITPDFYTFEDKK